MRIVLITGASSGLGAAFAERIDRTEKNIDEIWITARRRERLEEVAERLCHKVRVLPMDLMEEASFGELGRLLADGVQVGLFVNCAGYGKIGAYNEVTSFDAGQLSIFYLRQKRKRWRNGHCVTAAWDLLCQLRGLCVPFIVFSQS